MSHLIRPWKQLVIFLCVFALLLSCKKQRIGKDSESSQQQQQFTPFYEPSTDSHGQPHCGTMFTTDLKIEDGTNIGTVDVSNDSQFLFLTYHLNSDWYLTGAQSFAGEKNSMPLTTQGSPNYNQFPGKETLNPCDLIQNLTFKILLSQLHSDPANQCPSGEQFFIGMRASVKQISNPSDCAAGASIEAWAAPVLINPGDASEWATAFYYCRQDCENTTDASPASSWCAFGQGYWFAKPDVVWCQNYVQFGSLSVTEDDAKALWPAQNNILKKVFFQASALQLSRVCNNNNDPVPQAIADDYNKLVNFLSGVSYTDIENGTIPANTDIQAIQTAAGNIGKWICQNNCNPSIDPTICQ
jgi:hypothetical protein